MKSIYVCTAAIFALTTQAAAQEAPKRAPGEHALAVRDGRIVHVRKDQGTAAPRSGAETVTTREAPARTAAPGEHVVAVHNGRIVYIPKRHLAP